MIRCIFTIVIIIFLTFSAVSGSSNKNPQADIRIGERENIYISCLDIHRASGNLFVVLANEETEGSRWSVYISTNGGITWNETFTNAESYPINSLSMTVVDDYCYVAYCGGSANDEGNIRRFLATDGSPVDFTGGVPSLTIFSITSPESIEELSLTSNQDFQDDELYLLAVTSTGDLKYFHAGTSTINFAEKTTGVTNASRGLDACTMASSGPFLLASYIDNLDSVHVGGLPSSTPDTWNNYRTYRTGPSAKYTSISAYNDTVTCFFEYHNDNLHCRYLVSYNAGNNWFSGFPDDTTITSDCPDVTGRNAGGVGIIYRFQDNGGTVGRYTWRRYKGSWLTPEAYTEHEPSQYRPSIENFGEETFGMVYLSHTTPYERAAYFHRIGSCCIGIRGNVNADPSEAINITDITYLVAYCFGGGPAPECIEEGNANADPENVLNISDITYLVAYCFGGGPEPEACP